MLRGWAARQLGQRVSQALDGSREARPGPAAGAMPEAVKARLKEIYGVHYTDDIESRDGAQIIELADNVATGVPMGTPVFDGARDGDVSTMLAMAGRDKIGRAHV